jgi:hypothetical protein
MRPLHATKVIAAATLLTACPAPPTTGARIQEAASDLNTHSRFGRMELAMERVAPTMRDEFLQHRRAWGGEVRLADYELTGARLTAAEDADVTIKYSWYRPAEGDLRVTTVRQRWHDNKGEWQLVGEVRVDGDVGLLGERIDTEAPREPKAHAQFPTVRIGGAQ